MRNYLLRIYARKACEPASTVTVDFLAGVSNEYLSLSYSLALWKRGLSTTVLSGYKPGYYTVTAYGNDARPSTLFIKAYIGWARLLWSAPERLYHDLNRKTQDTAGAFLGTKRPFDSFHHDGGHQLGKWQTPVSRWHTTHYAATPKDFTIRLDDSRNSRIFETGPGLRKNILLVGRLVPRMMHQCWRMEWCHGDESWLPA